MTQEGASEGEGSLTWVLTTNVLIMNRHEIKKLLLLITFSLPSTMFLTPH